MAKRKKTKAKKKAKKKTTRKGPATRRKVAKKTRRATTARRKAAKKKPARPKAAAAVRPKTARPKAMAVPKPAAPAAAVPANEERIGVVTHYYTHLGVAIIQLESGVLREGDTVHIKGHTSDFTQRVGSMEIEHVHVAEARPGQSFGLKVNEHAREHDVVYRVKGT